MSEQDSGARHSRAPPEPGGPEEGAAGGLLAHLRPGFALEVEQACARIAGDVLALEEAGPGRSHAASGAEPRRARALRLLHGLRGTAATLGAARLQRLAAELERELCALAPPLPAAAADALLHGLEQLVGLAQEWARPTAAAAAPPAPDGAGPQGSGGGP